jgi:putative FmdB family regulatory protein
MPIYDYMCYTCKKQTDRLVKFENKDIQYCSVCDDRLKTLVSAPAKTAMKWGVSGMRAASNVNGVFDRGLGATYYNSMEREKIAKSKGLVPLEDVGGDSFIDNRMAAELNIKAQQDKILADYLGKVEEYGGSIQAKVRAIEEILPAKDCLGNTGNVDLLSRNINTGEIDNG